MTLGEYIDKTMKEKGLTYDRVEELSRGQVTGSYVNKLVNKPEGGNPTVSALQAIARGLGVAEEEIFRVARGLPLEENAAYNTKAAELLRNYEECNPQLQTQLEIFATYLRHLTVTGDPNIPPEIRKKFQIIGQEE